MKQITFELLRHGPPNNQLLSPLTPYLALCGNHAAVTVRVPFDHNQLLHQLDALRYGFGDAVRTFQLRELSEKLGEMLGAVPGLTADLNRDGGAHELSQGLDDLVTHLRLIVSASELALLPFEMSLSPPGFPGSGRPLLLQDGGPVCLTREFRRIRARQLPWPAKPKLLFISAQPGDTSPVPFEDHLRVIHELLEPWADYSATGDERYAEHLVVLPEASCDAIEKVCSENQFSHVHILAHGISFQEGYDLRYGLALHNPMNPFGPADRVSGERLAAALMPVSRASAKEVTRPLAVTLASCDSGQQGGVIGPGGSVAYALHQADVPLVLGSLFPLSVAGSVSFIRVLYETLLWGRDPRVALYELRRRLYTLHPNNHDWASVTAYASLPENYGQWLREAQVNQTYRSMEAALRFADHVTERVETPRTPTSYARTAPPETDDNKKRALLKEATDRIEQGRKRLETLLQRNPSYRAQLAGKLAATEKRCAQAYFYFARVDPNNAGAYMEKWQRLLQSSRKHYWDVFETNRDETWAIVQYLSLDVLLRRLFNPIPDLMMEEPEEHNEPTMLWKLAQSLSINDLRGPDVQRRGWALSNLAELYMLGPIMNPPPLPILVNEYADRARQYAKQLVDLSGRDSPDVYFARRQLIRYDDWYWEIANIAEMDAVLPRVLEVLPAVRNI